jgi:hypothetical protein
MCKNNSFLSYVMTNDGVEENNSVARTTTAIPSASRPIGEKKLSVI